MKLEEFLARLYVDPAIRAAFLERPLEVSRLAGLSDREVGALQHIDRVGLELAAASFRTKRAGKGARRRRSLVVWFRQVRATVWAMFRVRCREQGWRWRRG